MLVSWSPSFARFWWPTSPISIRSPASLAFGFLAASGVALGQWLFLRRHRLVLPPLWILAAVAKWGMLVAVFQDTSLTLLAFVIGLAGVAGEAWLLRPLLQKSFAWQMPAFLLGHYVVLFVAMSLFNGALPSQPAA